MKKIYIKNEDLGFWTETPITVQSFEIIDKDEIDLVWCNHAGAIEEEHDGEVYNPNGTYHEWTQRVIVCNKCDAWRDALLDDWIDAPFEGVHYV